MLIVVYRVTHSIGLLNRTIHTRSEGRLHNRDDSGQQVITDCTLDLKHGKTACVS